MAYNNDTYIQNHRRNTITAPHRLSFWQKNEKAHKLYLKKGGERKGSSDTPKLDYGFDNFSFNDAHLAQWSIPEDVYRVISGELRVKVKVWSKAGAAVCTSLDRIAQTNKKAMSYAYPAKGSSYHLRRVSDQAATTGAETPPKSGIATPVTILESRLGRTVLMPSFTQQPDSAIGMESPPNSACDSTIGSPVIDPEDGVFMLPAVTKANPAATGPHAPATLKFDENSWETFTKKYNQELNDVRESLTRLKGYGRVVQVLCVEYEIYGVGMTKEALAVFAGWWKAMQSKVSECEARVDGLSVPQQAEMQQEYEFSRAKKSASKAAAAYSILDSA